MTMPELYWISGSPPAWRVMLALVLKGVPFVSHRLDHGKGENRAAAYLALNPKGQVPTLVFGHTVVRESIAILAWLDRAFPQHPLFGATPGEAAGVWQDVILFENDLRPAVTTIAQTLLNNRAVERAGALAEAVATLDTALAALGERLAGQPFLNGATPSAADVWLYPALGWIGRAAARTADAVPGPVLLWQAEGTPIGRWNARLSALPGVAGTWPPHWQS
ncbi:MAG: glutathione S-transferase family protein [Pseudomonadota bacterium]